VKELLMVIAVIVIGFIWWFVGKSISESKDEKNKEVNEKSKNPFSIVMRNIFYIIVGAIVLWLLSKFWFTLIGREP